MGAFVAVANVAGGLCRWGLMSLGAYVVGAYVAVAFVAVANVVWGLCRITETLDEISLMSSHRELSMSTLYNEFEIMQKY